jgi:hypothetical protein
LQASHEVQQVRGVLWPFNPAAKHRIVAGALAFDAML